MKRQDDSLENFITSLIDPTPVAKALSLVREPRLAAAFGVTSRTIRNDMAAGLLNPVRIARKTFFSREVIVRWWTKRQAAPINQRRPRGRPANVPTLPAPISEETLQA